MDEGPVPTSHLPDALVWRLPVLAQPLHRAIDLVPSSVVEASALDHHEERVQQFSQHIHLQLTRRAIADADRSALAVAIQVVEGYLRQIRLPGNGEHWLNRVIGGHLEKAGQDPLGEGVGFLLEAQPG